MIYSSTCTYSPDGELVFESHRPIPTGAASIAAAMEHRQRVYHWKPVTETQMIKFDFLGFMDVLTFVSIEEMES